MRIGIIGAGAIGSTLGAALALQDHDVRYGVRAATPGPGQEAPRTAAAFADVVIFAAPFGAWPDFLATARDGLAGKVIIDASNPVPGRDGELAEQALASASGSGAFVATLIPEARLARAFNTLGVDDLRRAGSERSSIGMAFIAVPDDQETVAELIRDVGLLPVFAGPPERSRLVDPGSRLYGRALPPDELRSIITTETTGLSPERHHDR